MAEFVFHVDGSIKRRSNPPGDPISAPAPAGIAYSFTHPTFGRVNHSVALEHQTDNYLVEQRAICLALEAAIKCIIMYGDMSRPQQVVIYSDCENARREIENLRQFPATTISRYATKDAVNLIARLETEGVSVRVESKSRWNADVQEVDKKAKEASALSSWLFGFGTGWATSSRRR